MNTDTDASIRQTDTDALLARLSAVEKGYIADPYVRRFVPARGRWEPRGPLMNVGTYVRGRAVDGLVEGWFEGAAREGRSVQVVSMGAGSDTRFWRVATGEYRDLLRVYVEIDFAEVTSKKAMAIRKSKELSEVLGDVRVENGGTTVHGEKYHLLAADLRLGPETTLGRLLEPILDWSVATLLLFECVLVYMEPGASDGILRWFAGHVEGPLGGIVYEMFGLEDAFGKVMVENLKARGVLLPGAVPYSSVEKLPGRFLGTGFERAGAVTLRELWRGLGAEERARICGLEGLDEVEELVLVLGHYGVTWGLRGTWSAWDKAGEAQRQRED
ncbi:hypothetical protein E4T56_gene5999 [Termitomyces sp. T112]|nr:hypothetical protein E4T56_gene5999 [Termitomyces sp. T112]